jgi:hypothetical protein
MANLGKVLTQMITPMFRQFRRAKRLGFMAGQMKIPDDFNSMGADEIQPLFEGKANLTRPDRVAP